MPACGHFPSFTLQRLNQPVKNGGTLSIACLWIDLAFLKLLLCRYSRKRPPRYLQEFLCYHSCGCNISKDAIVLSKCYMQSCIGPAEDMLALLDLVMTVGSTHALERCYAAQLQHMPVVQVRVEDPRRPRNHCSQVHTVLSDVLL